MEYAENKVLESDMLDAEVKDQELKDSEKTLVTTTLRLLEDYQPTRLNKIVKVKRNIALIDSAISGEIPTRLTSMPSYLVFHIVKLFSTLIDIPDRRLLIPEVSAPKSFIMSAFVDLIMREGGYHEALMGGWGGYKDLALHGNTILAMGLKDNGMPIFHCVPIETLSFTLMSNKLRTQTGIGATGRYVNSIYLTLQQAEKQYPGILKLAIPGELPSSELIENNQELSDDQKSAIKSNEIIQIAQMVDSDFKVKCVVAGANAALINSDEGEDFPFVMEIDGEMQPFLNIVKADFENLPKGIYAAGAGDMFGSLNDIDTKLSSSKANVAIDNNNAAPILNVPGATSESVFQQVKMTERAIKEGKRAYMAFDPEDNNGQQLGRATIDYLRNTFPEQEAQSVISDIVQRVERSGFSLDYLFTNPNKTNLQTKLDIEANNQNIIDIQSHNMDFYKMPVLFTIFAIQNFGKVNDKMGKMQFGSDLKIDLGSREATLGEINKENGAPATTRGDIIQLFKDMKKEKKPIAVEVDVKTGVSFNKRLEEDNLLKQLRQLQPGSASFLQVQSALSMLYGGKELAEQDVQGEGGAVAPEGLNDDIKTALEQ